MKRLLSLAMSTASLALVLASCTNAVLEDGSSNRLTAAMNQIQSVNKELDSWEVLVTYGSRPIDIKIQGLILGFVPSTTPARIEAVSKAATDAQTAVGLTELKVVAKTRWSQTFTYAAQGDVELEKFLLAGQAQLQKKYLANKVVIRDELKNLPARQVVFYVCAAIDTPADVIAAIQNDLTKLVDLMDSTKDFSKTPETLSLGLGC